MSAPIQDKSQRQPAVKVQASGFSFSFERIVTSVLQSTERHLREKRIADTRRETQREIARMPDALRNDIALADKEMHHNI